MTFLLALDQGTSSSRAFVVNEAGLVIGRGQEAFDMSFPASGWVEQAPEVLWDTQLAAARSALVCLLYTSPSPRDS